ncbi:MAG TPA: O-methyltransferase [Actinomycetota bacterium]|nr:O-methyltransferase [Actinomycetota bacterium]
MDVTNPKVEDYIRGLLSRHDDAVLLEMEAQAKEHNFPIVGRMVGVALEILARSINAKRVFELGSGYGYSAYWFSRAVGEDGEIQMTDGDAENERKALDYLGRAGLDKPVRFHIADAVKTLRETQGTFDIVFNDIDKWEYPAAWAAARDRIRPGGFYICDNTLAWGSAFVPTGDGGPPDWLTAVREHNETIFGDDAFLTTILPIRDGVLVARRT